MKAKPVFIYVMATAGHSKIGISHRPGDRRCNIQTSNPLRVELHWVSPPLKAEAAYDAEQAAHETLTAERTYGEWFAVDPEIAVEAVKEAMASAAKSHPRAHRNPQTVSGLIHGETPEEWLAGYNRGPQPGDVICFAPPLPGGCE